MQCPDENELLDLAAGRCDAARREALDRHLDGCGACADELGALLAPAIRPPAAWGVGDRVGRYLITSRLGRGGMGVVFAAHDELLGRTVAIKVLRTELRETDRDALLHEAQALARVVHPNIVPVFDVGTVGDDVYFAMELVEGSTLRKWLHGRAYWRDAIPPLCAAGDALVAAHRDGVTHGDFKPDNVLVTSQGAVKVVDFGLATLQGVGRPQGASLEAARGGSVVGTPSYLSPEQHAGARADAMSDQYAFGVALFEAIFGRPPFGGRTLDELARAKAATPTIPTEPRIPARLRRAVARALAPAPGARWPDLEMFVAEVRRAVSRRPPSLLLALGVAGGLGLGAIALDAAGPRCDAEGALAAIERRWTEIVGTLGPEVGTRGRAALDAAASAWRAEFAGACAAADAMRLTCLGRRKAEIASWLDVLAAQAERRPYDVVRVIDELGDDVGCDTPMTSREAAARARLAHARSLRIAGDHDAALEALDRVAAEVAALGLPALATDLAQERAMTFAEVGDPREPEATEAWLAAAEIADDPAGAARAASRLAVISAETFADADGAERWLARADTWIARAATGQQALRVVWLIADSAIAWRRREVQRATDDCRRAVAIAEEVADPELRETASSHLGVALARQGRVEESIPLFEQQLAEAEARIGAAHPRLARVLLNLGASYSHVGRRDDALRVYDRARTLLEASGAGPTHPELARIEHNLTGLHIFAGDYPRAELHARRALAAAEHATESATLRLEARYNLGATLDAMGRVRESEEVAWRGAAEVQELYGDEHPLFASFLDLAGDARSARGAHDGALELHRRALAITLSDPEPDPVRVADMRVGLADDLVRLGRTDEAAADLATALAALAELNPRMAEHASARIGGSLVATGDPCRAIAYLDRVDPEGSSPQALFARATARRSCGVDDNRAVALARAALAKIDDAETGAADLRATITAWLAE